MARIPNQRWRIASSQPEIVEQISLSTGLLPLVSQVIVNRGIENSDLAHIYIDPETEELPSPLEEFPDLAASIQLLEDAIAFKEKIAICGDYDADGMTSTALLLRTLRHLGADVDYAIPSRMKDGYGINQRIVEEFAENGVGIILTVDNGISAYEPVLLAVELGLIVIITDHHDLPEKLPPADAILNPKLLNITSPYRGLAGVGVAYILAIALAKKLNKVKGLTSQLLELFTLGTIADLAPLVGVNRRWLKRGLRQLPNSELPGIQALMTVAGVNEEQKQLQPDDIGFRLGPRINAIGRIGDPQLVIELLTTDETGIALERAMRCEAVNSERQQLCEKIQKEAIELVETKPIPWKELRVLVVVKENWHHGVIGIVASRLVERYGVPVFIGTYEEEEEKDKNKKNKSNQELKIRGSARGIEEFNIFEALNYCQDILGKYGGHKAAGGFSFPAKNLESLEQKLSEFAHQCLEQQHLKPLVKIDALAHLEEINHNLYDQIDSLQPWGIGNSFPVFWTPNVTVKEQKKIGKNQDHLKLVLQEDNSPKEMKAISWRWGEYCPLPSKIDIAYKLQENHWQGVTNIELEIVGVRLSQENKTIAINHQIKTNNNIKKGRFNYNGRTYACSLWQPLNELRIKNEQGKVLAIKKGNRFGLLGTSRNNARKIDITKPPYFHLIKTAISVLQD
ncbi:Single-stranded-DNA-specific exonuclease RecJ [Hyella patelloides LEGE 07179]|uniref:Single-stranded-DNA-specific exonuclease RecJ n=2 Tax=Hyella TaxID=945733 RepID=A0A563VL56_9CYAN|nr:single-stranded-DNA-specific exonuclease RecJ [Hyella patelloides]VEP12151.1 Single-stranded-DNA-specific exonuclease RecJ [Hyella patelloides LEGE 07179]